MSLEDELRRLRRFLVVSWSLLLICLLLLTYWGSSQIKNLKSSVADTSSKQPTVINGVNGKQGIAGANGITIIGPIGPSGSNGVNGSNVTAEQIAAAVSEYCSTGNCVGTTGPQGSSGENGRTVQLQVDPTTCQLQEKYTDDDFWITIAQLPKPCTPSETTE